MHSVDTDILVSVAENLLTLSDKYQEAVKIAFETGEKCTHIPVHAIAVAIEREKTIALPGFRDFTG